MTSLPTLGYSCWGFLGNGVVDTPDGGRSHRWVLLQALHKSGYELRLLQPNRDRLETGQDPSTGWLSFHDGFPPLDALMFEYRWPIPGRNTGVSPDDPAYTPDLDRQKALLEHYVPLGIPVIIWDKDQQLPLKQQGLLAAPNVHLAEPALRPTPGRASLRFPANAARIAAATTKLSTYASHDRPVDLVYIGNQYGRDGTFREFIDATAGRLGVAAQIYGKWRPIDLVTGEPFTNCQWHGRVGYSQVDQLYSHAFATVLIAPERYYDSDQYTQRLFEAAWNGCLPFVPSRYASAARLFPQELVVSSSAETAQRIAGLRARPQTAAALLKRVYQIISENFSPADQAATIRQELGQ